MKRLISFCTALVIAAGLIGSLPITVPEVATVAAIENSCSTLPASNFHTWTVNSAADRTGVEARVDTHPDTFQICNAWVGDNDQNGPSAWVSLSPKNGGTPNTIVQIGIIECADFGQPACGGDGNPHFWFARGGCNGYTPIPIDLGPANYSEHVYAVTQRTHNGGKWVVDFWIDGIKKYQMDEEGDQPSIGCWIEGELSAKMAVERWDIGDDIGNGAGARTKFTNGKWATGLNVNFAWHWFVDNIGGGANCFHPNNDDHCNFANPGTSSNEFTTWSF